MRQRLGELLVKMGMWVKGDIEVFVETTSAETSSLVGANRLTLKGIARYDDPLIRSAALDALHDSKIQKHLLSA
jgi:hypothetical protein